MEVISGKYLGALRCEATHERSGTVLITDAPVDNKGKGEAFSPTDLLATSIATCMMTLMGIQAQIGGIELSEMEWDVEKRMSTEGIRKVEHLTIRFWCKDQFEERIQKRLEEAALRCPVSETIGDRIAKEVTFNWGQSKHG